MSFVSGDEPAEGLWGTDGAMLRRDGNWTMNGAAGLTSCIISKPKSPRERRPDVDGC
jgi:hypothetical protein